MFEEHPSFTLVSVYSLKEVSFMRGLSEEHPSFTLVSVYSLKEVSFMRGLSEEGPRSPWCLCVQS